MSVEPLLNCVSQKLSVNLSVLTNRQKFCIRLPKWVFIKVDNRLKVTSFGDPQYQETTQEVKCDCADRLIFSWKNLQITAIFQVSESAFFPRMKNLHTKKTRNGSNFGWLSRQLSIYKSGRKTFGRMFVSGSLFVSPCPSECNFQSEPKIEPDLRLYR